MKRLLTSILVLVLSIESLGQDFNATTVTELSSVTEVIGENISTFVSTTFLSTDENMNDIKNTDENLDQVTKTTKDQVDEWLSSLTTSTPVRTFKDEEKAILEYVNTLLRQILPHIMNSASTKFSTRCMAAMMKTFAGIRKLKGWTLKLLDSSGKLSPGILSGRSYSMGDFDQCLAISVSKKGEEITFEGDEMFRGKYCLVRLQQHTLVRDAAWQYHHGEINASALGKLKEMIEEVPFVPASTDYLSHFVGVCIPSICTEEDVTGIVRSLPFPGTALLERCETRHSSKLSMEQRVIVGVLSFLIILVIIGTTMDKLMQFFWKQSTNGYSGQRYINAVLSFSILLNTRKLLQRVQNDHPEIPNWRVVRGLYVYTVMLIIIYHTYFMPFDGFYRQVGYLGNLQTYLEKPSFSFVVCLPLTIETLFFVNGFSLTNRIWKYVSVNKKVKLNIFKVIASNYCKLVIPALLCQGIVILLPIIGSGPFWSDIFGRMENCEASWGRVFGMYSNFLSRTDQCLPHIWFVACLMQLFMIAVVIMYILSRYLKFGVFLTLCAILGCNVAVGLATYSNKWPPAYVSYFSDRVSDKQWQMQESLPVIHFTPFAIGMLSGILMTRKKNFCTSNTSIVIGWLLALGLLEVCFQLMFSLRDKMQDEVSIAIYASLQKSLFALVVSWIALVTAYRNNGFVKSLLSWNVLDPLYKLSYLAYLMHLIIMAFHAGTAREHFHYSHIEIIIRGISYIVLSYASAYISYMLVVMPFKSLHVVVFSKFQQMNMTMVTSSNNGFRENSFDKPFDPEAPGHFNKF